MPRNLKITSLPSVSEEQWIDADVVLVHALFQILTDFVEKERPYEIGLTARLAWHDLPIPEEEDGNDYLGVDLEADREEWRQIFAIYHWWKQYASTPRQEPDRETDAEETKAYGELTAKLHLLVALRRHYWT